MDERENAKAMDGKLYRVFRCFGREFPVYYQYSDEDGNAIPGYPDFEDNPQYTEDGRPFVLRTTEGCEYGEAETPGERMGNDCGGCKYFRAESEWVYSLFGVCMCDVRRLPQKKEETI